MDMPFELQYEDEGQILDDAFLGFNQNQNQDPPEGGQGQGSQEGSDGGQGGEGGQAEGGQGASNQIDWDGTGNQGQQQQGQQAQGEGKEKTREEIIAELQAEGYDVKQPESQEAVKTREIQTLEGQLQEAKRFLAKPMSEVIKSGLFRDLSAHYKSQGREGEIDSDVFRAQLDQEVDRLENSSFVEQQTYYNQVKNGVNQYISGLEANKNKLEGEVTQAANDRSRQQRENLQTGLSQFVSGGYLGTEISPDIAKKAYQRVVSGSMQKELNSNHNLIAELALYLEMKPVLAKRLGQPSYGEGVKKTLDAIEKGDQSATSRSSLDTAMRSGQAPGGMNQGAISNTDGRFGGPKYAEQGQEAVEASSGGRFASQR